MYYSAIELCVDAGESYMLNPQDVRLAYLAILDREPESEAIIQQTIAQFEKMDDLRQVLFKSDEYIERNGRNTENTQAFIRESLPITAPPLVVETKTTQEELEKILNRISSYWSNVGEEAPHWSVLTDNRFLPDQIEEHLESFYETGLIDASEILACLARASVSADKIEEVVEFGCGVGRVTLHLGGIFNHVVACDISKPHLKIAEEFVSRKNLTNIVFRQVTPENLLPAQKFDLFYSGLVLQHNPPPISYAVLDYAFKRLNAGGIAIFQIPSYLKDYSFRVEEYLAANVSTMEMHCIPQKDIFKLASDNGLDVLEVRENTQCISQDFGSNLSMLYVLQKRSKR